MEGPQQGVTGVVNATAWFTLRLASCMTAVMRNVRVELGGWPATDIVVTADEVSGATAVQEPSGFW